MPPRPSEEWLSGYFVLRLDCIFRILEYSASMITRIRGPGPNICGRSDNGRVTEGIRPVKAELCTRA
ncbi:hypothetical protein J6590_074786 [Homalodisca vitripennis]|nr:hypothetical protein J6590_074786 [Homalodisca vitripennis]